MFEDMYLYTGREFEASIERSSVLFPQGFDLQRVGAFGLSSKRVGVSVGI
jgi:hypothetical protein